jgi:DNA-binding transcriptional regulator GbsR (MarR family)
MSPTSLELEFARFAGDMAESLSFSKSIGQIYGLLYIQPDPLSLDDIAKQLGMSKGNASINLRVLESWGAVRPVSMHASRRDFYRANTNLKELFLRRIKEGMGRRLEMADEALGRLSQTQNPSGNIQKRVTEIRSQIDKAKKFLSTLDKMAALVLPRL